MRRVPIRFKLLAVLAVPLLTILVLVIREVVAAAQELGRVRAQAELATAINGPEGLLTALQHERNWAVVSLIGMEDGIALEVMGTDETRAGTDEALAEFSEDLAERREVVADAYQPALEALAGLDGLRDDLDAFTGPRSLMEPDTVAFGSVMFERYGEMIEGILDAGVNVTLDVEHRSLRVGADLVDLSSRQIEVIAGISHLTLTNLSLDSDPLVVQLGEFQEEFDSFAATMRLKDSEPYRGLVTEGFPDGFTEEMHAVISETIQNGAVDLGRMLELLDAADEESYVRFGDDAADLLDEEAARFVAAAEGRRLVYAGIAFSVLLGTILTSWFATRSITRPLRSLTRQAGDMADRGLPEAVREVLEAPLGTDVKVPELEPIQVATRDEVADVVEALNIVQGSALGLAVEQAVMRRNIADSFVNLGRRNQNLLGRQLDFITRMERDEADPDTLGNLFRLDHLATRMRRNAESLLVLAGIEPSRRWTDPIKVSDVVRSALGEVEAYQRVTTPRVDPARIIGSAAADVAHLLAELLDNALAFSPPHQAVEVYGWFGGKGDDPTIGAGGYALSVVDKGLGMDEAELARANRRLAGHETFTVAPSKYLGHYVAGRLAARHNLTVQLRPTSPNGVTAVVTLPPELLVADDLALGAGGAASSTPQIDAMARVLPAASQLPPPSPAQPEPQPQLRAPLASRPRPQPQPHPQAHVQTQPQPRAELHLPAHSRPRPSSSPSHGGATSPASTASGAAPLARREPQGDRTRPSLGEPFRPTADGRDVSSGHHRPGHGPGRSAEEVNSFLSGFVDGVQRGLAEARAHDQHPPPSNGPTR